MKKMLFIIMAMIMSVGVVFAGPHGGRGGRGCGPRHGCPPPPRYYYGGCGNSGVRLAADIVGLVGAGLNILAPRTVVVNSPAPAYVAPTPVVYPTPTYVAPQPVYTAPAYVAPQPVYVPPCNVYTPVRRPVVVYRY